MKSLEQESVQADVELSEQRKALEARLNDKTLTRKTVTVEIGSVPIGLSHPCACGEKFVIQQPEILQALENGHAIPNVCPKCDADLEFVVRRVTLADDRVREKFGLKKPNLFVVPGLPK